MRALRVLYRHAWLRWLPHGTLSWRFFWVTRDPHLKLHRHWWLKSVPRLPRLAWLLLESWLYLRWLSFFSWRACWRVWRRLSPEVARVDGIAPAVFGWRLLRLALGSCIQPREACEFGLYRNGGHARRWQYVYTQEIETFHHWCNDGLPSAGQAARELADKALLLERLQHTAVPRAEVCGVIRAGSTEPEWRSLPSKLFLKPRFGSSGRNCFIRTVDGGHVVWRHFLAADPRPPLDAWRRESAQSDYLVMPYYGRTSRLAELSPREEAVTLRVITCLCTNDLRPLCAILEPASPRGGFEKIPLHLDTGRPLTVSAQSPTDAWETAAAYLQRLVPAAVASAIEAHRCAVPGYRAIAWDFLLTDDQPLLLEGNSRWEVAPLQYEVGLLSPENEIGTWLQPLRRYTSIAK